MPLTDPNAVLDPVVGGQITSAWGDALRSAIMYLGSTKPRARVFNSANISIANNTLTALTFDSERRDVGGCHSTVSNTERLTVPAGEAGDYLIGCGVRFAANTTGRRAVLLRLNGTTTIAQQEWAPNATSGEAFAVLDTYYPLVAADYIEVVVFQTSGAALNVEVAANYSPEFWWKWDAL